jgi:hypothetical protein
MIPPATLTQAGVLPFKTGPVRFAVGPPDGLTSNAWRLWTTKAGDVYIACRDNFKEVKVSLHASGRWRMGFTTEALAKNPTLVADGKNRAWDVWDRPPETIPNTVRAFQLVFPTSQLAVRADQRRPKDWSNIIHIEAAPQGKLTVLTLFVTCGNIALTHESEPSFCLASLDLGNGLYAQLVAHGDPEGNMPDIVTSSVAEARRQTENAGIVIPDGAYGYFLGQRDDGTRFIFGALVHRRG